MIYTCDACGYVFYYEIEPKHCPDCGSENIRIASDMEKRQYYKKLKYHLE